MAKQTNEEKFRTAEERSKAFKEWCKARACGKCELDKYGGSCIFLWLALEAEDEKPENCPFCEAETICVEESNGSYVKCSIADCGYRSGRYVSLHYAVAAHNSVARAVRAAKKGETE